ncbi:MAG: hypothetical protein WB762_13035 [Candidatus Sulfotelmatobacter sp.]
MAAVAVRDLEIEVRRKKRVFAGRNVVLKLGEAKALGALVLSVFNHRQRQTGDMGRSYEFGNGGFDLCELVGRKFAILSLTNSGTPRSQDGEANAVGAEQSR